MPKRKTHARLDITLPISMVAQLRRMRKKTPISQQIANSLMATRPADFEKKLLCRRGR